MSTPPWRLTRHAALTESTLLRALPPHLWHHAHTHTEDLIRLYLAHGRVVRSRPFPVDVVLAGGNPRLDAWSGVWAQRKKAVA